MVKAVLDTNVFVSGLRIKGSKPAKIIDLWRDGRFLLAISNEIINEYLDVLSRPHLNINIQDIREISQYLYLKTEIVKPKRKLKVIQEDPSDNMFLECAFESCADYIVSGDNHLIDLREFERIKILRAADFLNLIERS